MPQDKPLQAETDTIRIPLLGEMKGSKSTSQVSGFVDYFNCWPEIYRHPSTGEEEYVLQRLPILQSTGTVGDMAADLVTAHGLTKTNLSAIAHIGMAQMSNVFIAAFIDKSTGTVYIMQHSIDSTTTVEIGSIAKLGAISTANSLYDTVSIQECQIANAGTVYPGITVVRTAFDRSLSKCYHARASATTFSAATLTQITDADFPDQLGTPLCVTGPIIQMNGIFHCITTTGVIYSSGGATGTANDPSTWTSTAIIQTYQDPDQGVTLARYKHHILAFGTNSVEFFNDVGNPAPASPLERTEQAAVRFGTVSPKSVLNVADTIYWIAAGKNNTTGLYKMDGYVPQKVSTPREDVKLAGSRGISSSNSIDGCSLVCLNMAGKVHIGINAVYVYPVANNLYYSSDTKWASPSASHYSTSHAQCLASGVLLYNTVDNVWWNMMTWVDEQGDSASIGNALGILPANSYLNPSLSPEFADATVIIFQRNLPGASISSGRCDDVAVITNPGPSWGSWSPTISFGDSFPMIVQFNALDFGNNRRKKINKLELLFANSFRDSSIDQYITVLVNKGDIVSINHPSTTIPLALLKKFIQIPSWDGVSTRTYTSPTEPLELQGVLDRYYLNNLGMGRKWQFSILYGGTTPFPLTGMDLVVSQGTS